MIQFINIVIYMNSFNEKEKKLLDTLEKLKNFEILTIKNSKEIKLLENKKNQLEIEKTELVKKYNFMKNEYEQLKVKLNYFDKQRKEESKKEKKFEEKIDELNQETDILIDEIDKWQM